MCIITRNGLQGFESCFNGYKSGHEYHDNFHNDLMKKERSDIQGLFHKDHHLFVIDIKDKILMAKVSTNEPQIFPKINKN
jgi:hypothetical protein